MDEELKKTNIELDGEKTVEERLADKKKDASLNTDVDGQQVLKMAENMYGTTKITQEQLSYILDMLSPANYMLRNHSVKGHPMTFSITGRDRTKAQSHRPWQQQILEDESKDLAVMKSRQLGLSEISSGKLLHFVDTHSYDKVKALYTFPTEKQMNDFVSTRINPLLSNGYYSSITDKRMDSNKRKRIRDSIIYFRSSSKASAVEGVDVDVIFMDEYDHVSNAAEQSAIESMASSKYGIKNRWSTPKHVGGLLSNQQ